MICTAAKDSIQEYAIWCDCCCIESKYFKILHNFSQRYIFIKVYFNNNQYHNVFLQLTASLRSSVVNALIIKILNFYLLEFKYMATSQYNDVKLAERFIFQNSVYLLDMLEKKIDSFIINKPKKREKEYLNPDHIVEDPQNFFESPIKNLSKDLTKPVWNCKVKGEPVIILQKDQGKYFYSYDQKIKQDSIAQINYTLSLFLERYKNQHEDESNFEIYINYFDRQRENYQHLTDKQYLKKKKLINRVDQLMLLIYKYNQKESRFCDRQTKLQKQNQDSLMQSKIVGAANEIILQYIDNQNNSQQHKVHPKYKENIWDTVLLAHQAIDSILSSTISSSLFCYYTQKSFLPLIIHPLLMAIFTSIKTQLGDKEDVRQEQRISTIQLQTTHTIFQELKTANCSKITFINFDGFQSEYNIPIANYLSKYLQYISFPLELYSQCQNQLKKFKNAQSKRFFFQHCNYGMSDKDKQDQQKLFKTKRQQMKKRMFIFPINSIYMRKGFKQSFQFPYIQNYASNFINFMMKEMIYNQIKQFNPSIIIVSYTSRLDIKDIHFQQIIKQLTVLSNLRILFYPNLNHNFIFSRKLPSSMIGSQDYNEMQEKINQNEGHYYKLIKNNNGLNYDYFNKISMFLKISSGTFTLTPLRQEDSLVEKYKNSKIMGYIYNLFRLYTKDHPVFEKMKMRTLEYQTLEKVLFKYYKGNQFQNMFENIVNNYHKNLIQNTKQILRQNIQIKEFQWILHDIKLKFGQERDIYWEPFIFQYQLYLSTQKTYTKYYAYIPRLKQDKNDNLIGLQFERKGQGRFQLTSKCQVYYSQKRRLPKVPIYILNHLESREGQHYKNYVGFVTEQFDYHTNLRVQLQEITFESSDLKLSKYQYLTKFNYHQSQNYIFLYWPQLYNDIEGLLHQFAGIKYSPMILNHIYIAQRQNPFDFRQIIPANQSYRHILPRTGCTTYEINGMNCIYIFGGFYTNKQNYLKFQIDITCIRYSNSLLQIQNVPKNFFFDYKINQINNLKNDFIRPRVEYEIYETQNQNNQDNVINIFLIGGLGQKFMRPYSYIGYMAHKVTFNKKNGDLIKINRIKMNNIVPVNLRKPIKSPVGLQLNKIINCQNRRINTQNGPIPYNAVTLSRYKIHYQPQDQKFTYTIQYELADLDRGVCQKDLFKTQWNKSDTIPKNDYNLRVFRGLRQFDNFALVSIQGESTKRYILNLHLEITSQMQAKYSNLKFQKKVHLVSSSILALDTHNLQLYVIIKHPGYTSNKCILTFADLTQLMHCQNDLNFDITLKEIYIFDCDVSHNILKIANNAIIAILHGCSLGQHQFPQMILKRHKLGIKQFPIQKSITNLEIKQKQRCTSFFHHHQDGLFTSYTFKTEEIVDLEPQYQIIKFVEQKIDLKQKIYKWQTKKNCNIKFNYRNISIVPSKFKLIQMKLHKKSDQIQFQLFGLYQSTVFITKFGEEDIQVLFQPFSQLQKYERLKYLQKSKDRELMILHKQQIFNNEMTQ